MSPHHHHHHDRYEDEVEFEAQEDLKHRLRVEEAEGHRHHGHRDEEHRRPYEDEYRLSRSRKPPEYEIRPHHQQHGHHDRPHVEYESGAHHQNGHHNRTRSESEDDPHRQNGHHNRPPRDSSADSVEDERPRPPLTEYQGNTPQHAQRPPQSFPNGPTTAFSAGPSGLPAMGQPLGYQNSSAVGYQQRPPSSYMGGPPQAYSNGHPQGYGDYGPRFQTGPPASFPTGAPQGYQQPPQGFQQQIAGGYQAGPPQSYAGPPSGLQGGPPMGYSADPPAGFQAGPPGPHQQRPPTGYMGGPPQGYQQQQMPQGYQTGPMQNYQGGPQQQYRGDQSQGYQQGPPHGYQQGPPSGFQPHPPQPGYNPGGPGPGYQATGPWQNSANHQGNPAPGGYIGGPPQQAQHPYTAGQHPLRRKSLLIGINYVGTQHTLRGCQQDVTNMAEFLRFKGYPSDPKSQVIMRDDAHTDPRGPYWPTGKNMLAAMHWLISEPNTCNFLHYSGHGSQVEDPDGDRESGYDDTIVPIDFETNGQLDSDKLHRTLVSALPASSTLFVIFDCCHSGSAIELPFVYQTDEDGNLRMMDNLKTGINLIQGASSLVAGGFTMDKLVQARSLFAGANTFFKQLQHSEEGQGEGVSEEHFAEDWGKTEHKFVTMYSGCRDDQTSADANIGGASVGAMSWAFLETMKRNPNPTYLTTLQQTREILDDSHYKQVPQLSIGIKDLDLEQPLRF